MSRPLFLGFTDERERPTDTPARPPSLRAYLSEEQRATGVHVIGGPGSGKSKALEHWIRQDLDERRGLCLIDPHGELYDNVLRYCAAIRLHREIIPLNLSDERHVIGFNPFGGVAGDAHTRVDRCIDAIVRAWGQCNTDDTPRIERWLRNVFYPLVDKGLTIAEARHLLFPESDELRDFLIAQASDPVVRADWRKTLAGSPGRRDEKMESTEARFLRFLTKAAVLRFMSLAAVDSLDLRAIMDRGAVLLVDLRQTPDRISREDARLFGSLLVSKFFEVARGRYEPGRPAPKAFYLYCDEFQNFVSPDVAEILPQGRKFGLSLILAHQFLGQLTDEDARLVDAVMSAARTKVVFGGLSRKDAEAMVPEVFAGLLDLNEVKRIEYHVEHWPRYAREKVYTETEGEAEGVGESHTHAVTSGSAVQWGTVFVDNDGWTQPTDLALEGGTLSGGHSRGRNDGAAATDGVSDADTTSRTREKSRSTSVADVPFHHMDKTQVPEKIYYDLEEQKHRLADKLTLQLQRYSFVKPREDTARPVLVPMLKEYPLPQQLVADYEAEMATKAGARTPDAVDGITSARTLQITHEAHEFFDRSRAEALKSQEYVEPSRPKRRAKPSRQA